VDATAPDQRHTGKVHQRAGPFVWGASASASRGSR
jgi:hypothetical protein